MLMEDDEELFEGEYTAIERAGERQFGEAKQVEEDTEE